MYAIVRSGGKQYKVREGETVRVEKLEGVGPGDAVEFSEVLAVVRDGEMVSGTPAVEGARAIGRVVAHGRAGKIVVLKYKAKINYRRKRGHRQPYTEVLVEKIVV